MYALLRQLARIPHHRVRWLLLVAIGVASTVLALAQPGLQTSYRTYDRMLEMRLWTPEPDPKIVIVDIDEASLAELGKEFGRWPWPRETLAAVLAWLESQKAAAVVFDILFSELDQLNPASDQAFADAVARSRVSYFPILRLNPANDALSQVRADQLAGFAVRVAGEQVPTLAVTPPVFDAVVASTRLGYHNIFPSRDGTNRHYDLWLDVDGWRLWSLPARVGRDLGWSLPAEPRLLIRYNREPNAYLTISFADVWRLSQSQQGLAQDPRLDGAIVLIGSTASSLFDVKATPLSPIHPGVHVLANAIDNLKHADFVHELSWSYYLALTWVALALMGWASVHMRELTLNASVVVIPSAMLAVSFASLHFGHWFLDLSAPASQALTFFSVMSLYQRTRVGHFAQLPDAGRLAAARAGETTAGDGAVYQACLVLQYPVGKVNVQRLLDAVSASGAVAGVVQATWSGLRFEIQACPALVQLTAASPEALRAMADVIFAREAGFASRSHLSPPRRVSADGAAPPCYDRQEVWEILATAVLSWTRAPDGDSR